MASVPANPRRVLGRLDVAGRLIAADPELEALQRQAGAAMGDRLALPQIAAIAELARKLGIPVSRPAVAAADDHDLELWVNANPEGQEVALVIEGWTVRPATAPRLSLLLGGDDGQSDLAEPVLEWSADEELRLISVSSDLAELLGVESSAVSGEPLTRLLHLDEDEAGDMPLIAALASRSGFAGQQARARHGDDRPLVLSGAVVTGADGTFAGFRGRAVPQERRSPEAPNTAFDDALEEVLRSPLDRIIDSAERIVDRADGPLRSDYASYGNDISAAARHLLSVIRGMQGGGAQEHGVIDLAALAAEAVVMLESPAEEHEVTIHLDTIDRLSASGDERGVIQILVNLIVNAIHHSPAQGVVRLAFVQGVATASVTVIDEGPGIADADKQRIFERFERRREGGTGLGLAISRRLAQSMGGDVSVESVPGEGARFTLTLPVPG